MDQLLTNDIIYKNNKFSWAPAFLVAVKPGSSRFRFTLDFREVNRFTNKYHYPKPNLENELRKFVGSNFYANFDLWNGYWQLPRDTLPHKYQSFMKPDGIFTPTWVPHAKTSAVTHLQSIITANLDVFLRKHLLVSLEEILLYPSSTQLLLKVVWSVPDFYENLNFKIHLEKFILYTSSIIWCGRKFSEKAIMWDPQKLAVL